MRINSRLAVAIQVLALATVAAGTERGEPVTSEQMAESVNTNPVVVRRILGSLREAGLVSSRPGPGGGWRLTRPAGKITLRDVYQALTPDPIFALPRGEPNAAYPGGSNMPRVLASCFRDAEAAMEQRLARVTIADVIEATTSEGRRIQREAATSLETSGSHVG